MIFTLIQNVQNSANEANNVFVASSETNIWMEAFHIFQLIIIPLLLLILTFFIIFKLYKMLVEMRDALNEIKENTKKS